MIEENKTVAIVGAGVAGSRLACLLARNGVKTLLFDHRAPWEKPCGGGLTAKVFDGFPDIRKLNLTCRENHGIAIITPYGRRTEMTLERPIVTVSRKELGKAMLVEAVSVGTLFINKKIESIERKNDGVTLYAEDAEYKADIVVGADGAHSVARKAFASPLDRKDFIIAYGALLPEDVQTPIKIKFYKNYKGYAWIFPRSGATSVGIALEGGANREIMLRELRRFAADECAALGLEPPCLDRTYARLIPALRRESFLNPVLCGKDWALIGDASGAADPISGEGLYYAFKTAHLFADAILSGDLSLYEQLWKEMSESSIGKVSKAVGTFYDNRVLRSMGIIMDYSKTARKLISDIVSGGQGYDTLKSRLKKECPKYIKEIIGNLCNRLNDPK